MRYIIEYQRPKQKKAIYEINLYRVFLKIRYEWVHDGSS